METTASNSLPVEPPVARPAYTWFVVGILCVASIVSFIDRQIINLLVEPIKADFGINDTQIGLLQGFSFVLFLQAIRCSFYRDTVGQFLICPQFCSILYCI